MLAGGLMIVGSVMQYFGVIPFTESIDLFITGIQTFVYGAVLVAIPTGYYIPQIIKEEH